MKIELVISENPEFRYRGSVKLEDPTGETVCQAIDELNNRLRESLVDHALKGASRDRVRRFKIAMAAA